MRASWYAMRSASLRCVCSKRFDGGSESKLATSASDTDTVAGSSPRSRAAMRGRRGSYLPTAINVVQAVGWSIFEILIIATAAAALSHELFGFRGKWLWTLACSAVTLAFTLMGPIGFVRRFVRKVAVWTVPFAL